MCMKHFLYSWSCTVTILPTVLKATCDYHIHLTDKIRGWERLENMFNVIILLWFKLNHKRFDAVINNTCNILWTKKQPNKKPCKMRL